MKKRIETHINAVLKKYDINKEFKEEMINVCIHEYEKALAKGFLEEDAYNYALKDFDEKYKSNNALKYSKLHNILPTISFVISLAFILIFTFCNQFMSIDEFPWSIAIILIPNFMILLIKFIIISILYKGSVVAELKGIILTIVLYIPFIVIELANNNMDVINYLIALNIDLIFIINYLIIKYKKVNFLEIILILTSILITTGYFIIPENIYILELIIEWGCSFLTILISVLGMLKNKLKITNFVIVLAFMALFFLYIYVISSKMELYNKISIISGLLISVLLVQLVLKNKIIYKHLYIIDVFIILASLQILYSGIYEFVVMGLGKNVNYINYNYLLSSSLIVYLIVLRKYINNKFKGVN